MMKMNTRFVRRTIVFIMPLAIAGILLDSCTKGGVSSNVVTNAALEVVNLAPDQSAVNVTLSGNILTNSPLAYASYTGSYLSFPPGTYTVASANASSALASTSYAFLSANYYSLYVMGNNGSYRNVIAADTFSTFVTGLGNAYVRYVNAVVDTANNANVSVSAGTTTVFGEKASFGTVSGFKSVTAGKLAVQVTSSAGVDTTGSFTLLQDYAYTVLLIGVPNSTDAVKRVQVRILANGSLAK